MNAVFERRKLKFHKEVMRWAMETNSKSRFEWDIFIFENHKKERC